MSRTTSSLCNSSSESPLLAHVLMESANPSRPTTKQGTLSSIADSIYTRLVSADQIKEANSIDDPLVLDVGQNLV
ncbi:hypothetical protein OIU78_002664 [Salix suchowensis]|nr:hypothetical protein OIU78_002664 [Salix suchowensis]